MTEINKIISSGLLLVAGIGLNMITGNYVVTTIGCFLLGLLLNRSSKQRAQGTVPMKSPLQQTNQQIQPAPSSSLNPTTGISCGSCGAISGRRTKYCTKCGSKIEALAKPSNKTDQQRYTPQAIANSLTKVRGQNEAQYVNLVQNLLMVDEQGKYWSIGVNSSKWYVQGDGGWVTSQPQGTMRLTHRNIPILQSQQMVTPTPTTERKTAKEICRFCGAEMDASDAFCLNCGKQATVQLRPTATPPPTSLRKPTGIKCRFCGSEMGPSDTVCSKCFTRKEVSEVPIRPTTTPSPSTSTCKRCGATVNARKRFCTNCGKQLTT